VREVVMDFGMKNRLSRIINPKTEYVMLAVDHGYFRAYYRIERP
jgi:DhnA family fructose-bisphosphate aldolase class Ia